MLDSLQKTFRWRSGQLLRWLARRDPDLYGVGEPLFFHHIAKTGGTSLIDAVRRMTLPELGLSERGNLSLDFIQGLVARGLSPGQFIYGHPLVGAASPLRGRCNIVALLRDPKRQIISNYLHMRKHQSVPDHRLARETELREFLLARPYFAVFQTASLHVGIQEKRLQQAEDLINRLPRILAYLEDITFLGTAETAQTLLVDIAGTAGWHKPPGFPHHRKTLVQEPHRARMEEQLAELQTHSVLAPLFAIEQLVYDRAQSIARSRRCIASPPKLAEPSKI